MTHNPHSCLSLPELPEVETIVRDVHRATRGATIARVEVLRPDLIEGGTAEEFAACVQGGRIRGVTRRAKNIVVDLGASRLVVNLGMTGRLLVAEGGSELPTHLGVRFDLADGRLLLYRDVRRFGRLECLPAKRWKARAELLGHEPLSTTLTPAVLHELAGRSRVAVKTWLMDQKRVVGVGNIYASESLFRAGIDPRRPANTLTQEEAARLHAAIRAVLQEAIRFRGTTLLDYRDASGERGRFAKRLKVYDRKGEACTSCEAPIERIVQGGRSTFFCPKCQE
jgi:formamidopyrimidine-DNA glycosylase